MKRILFVVALIVLFSVNAFAYTVGGENYDYRIPFYTNGAIIDATQTSLPATIFLSSSSGINNADISGVYDELSYANRKKMALTTSDGATQVYVEIDGDSDDWSAENVALHFKAPSLTYYEGARSSSCLWLSENRAAYYNGYTYLAYVDMTNNKIKIRRYCHATKLWSAATEIASTGCASANAHTAPCVLVDSDGYIFVANGTYSNDGDSYLYVYKSTNTEDISAFNAAETAASYTISSNVNDYHSYPTLHELSTKDLVLIYRTKNTDGEWELHRVVRANGTGTWDTAHDQKLFEATASDDRAYYDSEIVSDRLHIAYHHTDESESNLTHDLYYLWADQVSGGAYVVSPTWYEADGGTVSLPICETAGNLVFDSDADWDTLYITAVGADSSNNPYIIAGVTDSVNTDKLLFFKYDSGWSSTTILEDDGVTWDLDGHNVSDGDIYIQDSNNMTALFCQKVGSYVEIKEYSTTNGGTNWSKTRDVTSSSTTNWQSPCYPADFVDDCRIVAWNGATYDHDYGKSIYYCGAETDYGMRFIGYDIFYLHYDKDAADNTTYVGDTTDAVTHNVWSGLTVTGVWHMNLDTTVKDSAANGYDLTVSGATETTGKINHGMDFVRASSHYLTKASVSLPDPGTFECWFKPDNSEEDNNKETLFSFDEDADSFHLIHKRADHADPNLNNTFGLQSSGDGSSSYHYCTGANGWKQGETHHYIITWNGTTQTHYLDGVALTTQKDVDNDSPPNGSGSLNFGTQSLGGSRSDYFDGMLDEVRLWGQVLTAAQAKVFYNSGNDSLFYFFDTEESGGGSQVISTGMWPKIFGGMVIR